MDTKTVKVGSVFIGGGNPIVIQSMLNKPWDDISGNVAQAKELEQAGCQIVRVAIPNRESVGLITALKENCTMPVVADIHFDYKLALLSLEAGVDKIRINPGNIGSDEKVQLVVEACKKKNVPIRIGVNAGSLEKEILQKYGSPTPQALVESALYHVSLLEKFGFDNCIISLKSSNVATMSKAYELISSTCNYPLHLGVTEAGSARMGLIKSSVGIGGLLVRGIGDTIRVSLTEDPVQEIAAAKDILKACGLHENGITVISCPTCGRTKVGLIELVKQVEEALKDSQKTLTVAVMGCAVNGPGEAREADIGIAGGDGEAILFKKGKIIAKYKEEEILKVLLKEIENM